MRTLFHISIVAATCSFGFAILPESSRSDRAANSLESTSLGAQADGVDLERAFPRLRFDRPVFLCGAGDDSGRLFVVEQAGVIRVFAEEEDVSSSEVFLDISERVSRRGNEEGLIGLAFHPLFVENGIFFVHYSSSLEDMTGTVSRFRVFESDPYRADPDSEEVLLEVEQPYRNHNGGMLAFGPDGFLYISFGDGGAANDPHGNGQNIDSLLGAILRIDVDTEDPGLAYGIPKSNPFAYEGEGVRRELWAFGLRNVWRFSFDRATGELWAGEVGQDRFEEIVLIEEGGNFGWNSFEGNENFSGNELSLGEHIKPVHVYPRELGISVTGGYVYRGRRFPELQGAYFFGDYASGNLWRLTRNEDATFENELVRRTGRSIASFGEDDAGELFLLSFDGGIYRVVASEQPEDSFADWPELLSETGLFESLSEGIVAQNVVPYEVNVPFWSDGAAKQRYMALPAGSQLGFRREGSWEVPPGATLLKSFEVSDRGRRRTLETRLIRRTQNGWEAATYVWNVQGDEARLATDGRQFELYQSTGVGLWHAPSASECSSCHVESSGFVLSLTTAQLNREINGSNQLTTLAERNLVSLPPGFDARSAPRFAQSTDESVDLESRARVWLDVNCAMCHRPEGTGNASIDLRFSTPLDAANLIDEPPGQGDLGIADARIVVPGKPERSLLLQRVQTLGYGRMPNMATNTVDTEGVRLLRTWIESLGER